MDRRARRATSGRSTPLAITLTLGRAEASSGLRKGERRRDDDPRTADERPEERRHTAAELDVGSPRLEHERLARRERREARRQPVGVDEIGASQLRAAAAWAYEAKKAGSSAARAGFDVRFATMPSPYAMPKSRKPAGETTFTSTPAARRC